jgi:hypothetical protein
MLRSLLRKLFRLTLLGGIAYGAWRMWETLRSEGREEPTAWPPSSGPEQSSGPSPIAEAPTPNGEATSGSPSAAEMPGNGHGASSSGESNPESGATSGSRTRSTPRPKTGPARKPPTGKAEEPPGERLWVPASGGVCPPSHPIKAKLSSKIFHAPGSRNYGRTRADRCYPDEQSAAADGLRPALR